MLEGVLVGVKVLTDVAVGVFVGASVGVLVGGAVTVGVGEGPVTVSMFRRS